MFFAAAAAAATTATLSSRRGRFLFVHVRLRPLVAVRATVNVAGLVGVPHTEVLKALAVADELRVDRQVVLAVGLGAAFAPKDEPAHGLCLALALDALEGGVVRKKRKKKKEGKIKTATTRNKTTEDFLIS